MQLPGTVEADWDTHDPHHRPPSFSPHHVDDWYNQAHCAQSEEDAGEDGQGGRDLVRRGGLHDRRTCLSSGGRIATLAFCLVDKDIDIEGFLRFWLNVTSQHASGARSVRSYIGIKLISA